MIIIMRYAFVKHLNIKFEMNLIITYLPRIVLSFFSSAERKKASQKLEINTCFAKLVLSVFILKQFNRMCTLIIK